MNPSLNINAIYFAHEGEGERIGTPQIFIRLQGCAIGCINCDSKETWSFRGEQEPISQIIQQVESIAQKFQIPCPNISITGGDPLDERHREGLLALLKELRDRNFFINIEISGQRFVPDVFELCDFLSCDFKTPSTGVTYRTDIIEQLYQGVFKNFQIKAVIANKEDFLSVNKAYEEILTKSNTQKHHWVLTPCYEPGAESPLKLFREIYQWAAEYGPRYKVIGQQHKWIYGPDETNV